jgi:hypothetical protein
MNFLSFGITAPSRPGPPYLRRFEITHSEAPQSVKSSGRMISSSQRPLPDKTQHSRQTSIHASGGIRTQILSRLAAADPNLRPRGHWDRHCRSLVPIILSLLLL